MKNLILFIICFSLLILPVSAHEHHDSTTAASDIPTVVTSDLDMDGDGIPDSMDSFVDLDGDGVHDLSPTYQQPAKETLQKRQKQINWPSLIFGAAALALIVVTIVDKFTQKNSEKTDEEDDDVSDE